MVVIVRMVVFGTVIMWMFVIVPMTVIVRMVVAGTMIVWMFVTMMVVFDRRHGCLTKATIDRMTVIAKDVELHRGNSTSNERACFVPERIRQSGQPGESVTDHFQRYSRINQGTDGHVAADPGKTVKVCDLHVGYQL